MKRLYYFLFLLVCIACSDAIIEQHVYTQDSQMDVLTRSGGDRKYDLLGFGYDITGKYFTNTSAKAQVIDPVALKKDYNDRVDYDLIASTDGRLTAGVSAGEYTKNLSVHLKLYSDSDSISAFKGHLESSFSSAEHYSAKYSIAGYSLFMRMKQLYMTAPNAMLSKYLTNKFKKDLETQDMEYNINNYGTHVLTNITLGARLDIMYRSLVASSMKKRTVESGCSYHVKGIFGINVDGHIDETLLKDNTEQELVYRAIGGNPNKPFVGSINADTQTPISIDISVWQSSCDTTNMQLIDAESQTVIPIYELVEDFAKKEQLKAAVMKYIREKSYIDVGDPIPLYRYIYEGEIHTVNDRGGATRDIFWPVKDYYYTTDYREYGQGNGIYTYDKILCYVYSASEHPTGTIPLYEYLYKIKPTSDKVKSYYTTDWNELGQGNEYYKYRRIACYVYALDSKPSNSIPLYSFSRYYEKVLRPYHFFIDLNEANYNKNNGSGNSSRRDSGSDRDSGSSRSSGSSVNNSARNSRSSRRPGTGGRDESTIKLSFATYSSGPDTCCYVLPIIPPR